jgi:exodeoxyribonuclease VII small subunit
VTELFKAEGAPKESATYKVMLEQVEGIVRDVSTTDLDLDDMVAKIEQGYSLIKTMRSRLDETKERIEKLRLVFE